jgi:hypothetical protein
MKDFLKLACVLVAFLGLTSWALAQDTETTEATGIGSIIGGDVAHARDDAIKDAKRNCVEQVVKVMVTSVTEVNMAVVVEDRIKTNAGGYIKSYQVLSESKAADGVTYEVKIRAVVEKSDIKDDIGELLAKKGNPRVMVMMEEQNIGENYWHWGVDLGVSEGALVEKFRTKGFQVVDKNQAMKKITREALESALEGDAKAMLAQALKYGAEVLVVGKAFAREASGASNIPGFSGTGMTSCQATVQARALNADDAKILASKTMTAPAAHIDATTGGTMALEKAGNLLGDYLIDQILKGWASTATTVTMNVRGVTMSDLMDFETTLEFEIRGVEGIDQRDFGGGVAEMEVKTWRNAKDLAREMSAKTLEKFTVNVTSMTANTIALRVTKKGR